MPRIRIMNAGTAQMSGSHLPTTQLSLASKSAWSPCGLHRGEMGGPIPVLVSQGFAACYLWMLAPFERRSIRTRHLNLKHGRERSLDEKERELNRAALTSLLGPCASFSVCRADRRAARRQSWHASECLLKCCWRHTLPSSHQISRFTSPAL